MLYMVTEAMCDEGGVLVEDPTYFVSGVAKSWLARSRHPHDGAGDDLEHLAATLERLKKSGEIWRLKMLAIS